MSTGKIYTRAGDDGTTRTGDGQQVSKAARRLSAIGAVDELNACIGSAVASGLNGDLCDELRRIQNDLFRLGAGLAGAMKGTGDDADAVWLSASRVERLERCIDQLTSQLVPLDAFILPGGVPGAAALHVARTVCRRAERAVVALAEEEPVESAMLPYLNRLSDALFVMARNANQRKGRPDVLWEKE